MHWFNRVLLGFAVCAAVTPAAAQESEKAFFAGKTVRMIVGFGPGGGYDIFSRMIAPYLAKTLGTTVIVENQPGAGGLIALNRIYQGPGDGLTLSLSNGMGAAFAQITGQSAARYDLAKFNFLATVGAPPGIWLVASNSPIREVSEAVKAKRQWNWAGTGATDSLSVGAAFTCEALALDCRIVAGYKGSADAGLAVTRGEMDSAFVAESSANNFVRSGQNWALATMSRTPSQFFKHRPTVFNAVQMNEQQTWVMDFHSNIEKLGRILVTSPGIPAARLAYLQAAVRETLHNPQLIAEGEKADRIIEYLDPVSTQKNANAVVVTTPEQKERVLKILARAK